jgi:hypothetical protein
MRSFLDRLDLCKSYHRFWTPPPKRRTVGVVQNALCAIDLGVAIGTVEKCMEHKLGAENTCAGGKLRINAFYVFFPQIFKETPPWGFDQTIL